MSRRAGLLATENKPPLVKLFEAATVLTIGGVNSATLTNATIALGNAPQSGTCYMFSISNGEIGIYKVVNRTNITQLYKSDADYGGYQVRVQPMPPRYWYAPTAAGTAVTTYGATMMLLTFSGYSDAQVDALLGSVNTAAIASREANTTGLLRVNSTIDPILLVAYDAYCDILDGSWELVKQCGAARASTINGSNLEAAERVYGGSIIGIY